ncbi:MAG: HD domain-containing protein [Candidatus Schekmanbacteria bacterium]|nr:MAG: HD domain-containing protein [Candidatus Schekmanbacteria bacterium]
MDEKRIISLKEGDFIDSCYAVKWVQLFHKKNGEPYLRLVLTDKTGEIPAICWNFKKEYEEIKVDSICSIKGNVNLYNEKLQVVISSIEIVDDEEVDFSLFVKTSDKSIETLAQEIEEIISNVEADYFKKLISAFFDDSAFKRKFLTHPAAKSVHHSWVGGLAEHTIGVCRICSFLAGLYELNSDLLITSALLHDIGKIKELKNGITANYTDEGRLIGHIILGVNMIDERISAITDFPANALNELKHSILSHHGELEFGSPIRPMTIEALALHYADNTDSKISAFKDWIEQKPDMSDPKWTQFWPMMDRFIYRNSDSD